jgi:hypothetical protein
VYIKGYLEVRQTLPLPYSRLDPLGGLDEEEIQNMLLAQDPEWNPLHVPCNRIKGILQVRHSLPLPPDPLGESDEKEEDQSSAVPVGEGKREA